MAKVYKLEVYITDRNNDYDREYIKSLLSDYFQTDVFNEEETKDFEWKDELRINMKTATREDFEKMFE